MSWNLITDDWRFKLLALGLAVLMLGAVAFAQNPPTSKDLTVTIGYNIPPGSNIVVINPPAMAKVRVSGFADAIAIANNNSVAATFDLAKVSPGPNVHANLSVHSLVLGVQVLTPVVPYTLNVDSLQTVKLPVAVRVTHPTTGWQVTKQEAQCGSSPPCLVSFTGPGSWEANLKAFADFTLPVENAQYDLLTQPVTLERNGQQLNLNQLSTEPGISLDPLTVNIHVEAKSSTTSRQVVLWDAPPSRGPAAGYRVTNVTVNPVTVVITGTPDLLATKTTIMLPPVDLTGKTSDATFHIQIPYPDGTTGSVANATVTYSISPNPNASPSP